MGPCGYFKNWVPEPTRTHPGPKNTEKWPQEGQNWRQCTSCGPTNWFWAKKTKFESVRSKVCSFHSESAITFLMLGRIPFISLVKLSRRRRKVFQMRRPLNLSSRLNSPLLPHLLFHLKVEMARDNDLRNFLLKRRKVNKVFDGSISLKQN